MIIEKIELKDLEMIKHKYRQYFNEFEDAKWNVERVDRRFKQLVERYDYIGLGLYIDNELIGFAMGCFEQFEDILISKLNELFISANHQSKGYGTKLLKAFESFSKEGGAVRIQLESANDEQHNHFYNEMNNYSDANNNVLKAKSLN